MPISINDFKKTDSESSHLLMDFLRSNRRVAYSLDKLLEMLASEGRKLTKEELERMLFLMEYGGIVESKVVSGVLYYRYLDYSFFKPLIRPR